MFSELPECLLLAKEQNLTVHGIISSILFPLQETTFKDVIQAPVNLYYYYTGWSVSLNSYQLSVCVYTRKQNKLIPESVDVATLSI